MTSKLFLFASLVLGSFTAAAEPTAPTPPGPPASPPKQIRMPDACKASGDVLFEIDQRAVVGAREVAGAVPTSELVLYTSGAWTFTSHADGKLARTASGCLGAPVVRTIRDDLKRATWQVKTADAACAAISSEYTVYSANGKAVWTQRMCQLDYLDEASQKSLAEISKILEDAAAPHTPPCCKK
jgi:hypothetical protein